MIVALLLVALLQDGPVTTTPAPRSEVTGLISDYAATVAARQRAAEATDSIEACGSASNRLANEDEFDCAIRLDGEIQARRRTGRLGFARGGDTEVPAWALSDPSGWEQSQCGATADDACRRQARNRLAMARARLAAEAPAATGSPADPDNCRMVMRRAESGFGGSLSRVCGDDNGSAAEAELDRLQDSLRPVIEPCDRPAALESHDAWIARCRAMPPR